MNFEVIYAYDKEMETKKWAQEIPFIQFPETWEIRIVPPFGGAVVRFNIKKGNAYVSVYLDCYDNLGMFDEPYWEIYPHDGDIYRCPMNNTQELLREIQYSINQQNKELK